MGRKRLIPLGFFEGGSLAPCYNLAATHAKNRAKMKSGEQEIFRLLQAWSQGDKGSLDQLIRLVYQDLRRLAHRYMVSERKDHTLQTTALVNETYLRLMKCARVACQDRLHFLSVCAQLMRRILIDHARSHHRLKRGQGNRPISLDENLMLSDDRDCDLVSVGEALEKLARIDPRKSGVVELRFFGGLNVEETAEVLNISPATVKRDWSFARAWLHRELSREATK